MIGLQFFSVVLFFIGILSSLRTLRAKRERRDSRFWPTTRGEVVDSSLTVQTVPVTDGRPITLYGAAIRYRFQLGRKFYESNRVKWQDDFRSASSQAQRALLDRYPIGRIVQVHYDPQRLGEAVLEPAGRAPLQLGGQLSLLLSLGFLMLGTAGVIAATIQP